jgi:predicted GNAT superfamily acetyltransferase
VELSFKRLSHSRKEFSIRRAMSFAEWRDCQRLQRLVWGMNEMDIVPLHMLRVFAEGGGLIMNAYDRAHRPIGTSVSFPLNHEGRPILNSHMTGVVRDWQNKGVGLVLKLEQRKFAIEKGLDLICWTYDPLRSQNNWFNLNKLGVIARAYYTNYYGNLAAKLYRGLDSDRFLAEWWVNSPRVKKRLKTLGKTKRVNLEQQAIVNETAMRNGTRRPVGRLNLRAHEKSILLEIPANIDQLRDRSASALHRWRADTRQLYVHYFKLGYIATETLIDDSADRRSFVRLERGPLERILQN